MVQVKILIPLVNVGLTADFVIIILIVEEIIVVAAVSILAEIVVDNWVSHAGLVIVYVLTINLAAI